MTRKMCALGVVALAPACLAGEFTLTNYQLVARYDLPAAAASEASAVTYNWDTGTLFVLGDEGDALAEISKTGVHLSTMTMVGFGDTEGVTYMGSNRFALVEERLQDAFEFSYTAGGSINRANLDSASLGADIGNVGLEGISYDPRTGSFVTVKEKEPQRVMNNVIDFDNNTAVVTDIFTPNLGVSDLSDVQVLSTLPSLTGMPDADNLLIYSQESSLLMEVDRSGAVLSTFDFSALAGDAEGVTIDSDGFIYVVGEQPEMFVLAPIPAPASTMALSSLAALAGLRRRR